MKNIKKLAFINAHILDPTQSINKVGTLIVEDKKISALITNKSQNFTNESFKIIDCKGLNLSPGFVDIKCHLRVPGEEHKENLSYASQSAASAGLPPS